MARVAMASLAILLQFLVASVGLVKGEDTCVFSVDSTAVPPNVVLLLDNGAGMERIFEHSAYQACLDYTPIVASQEEGTNGFFNSEGYLVEKSGNRYYIRSLGADLLPLAGGIAGDASNQHRWTINGRTITLPAAPSSAVDGAGIKDNGSWFRYPANYLNWLFFGPYLDDGIDDGVPHGAGNGSDLPTQTHFYYMKRAILEVAAAVGAEVNFGIYNFANTSGASQVQPLKRVVDGDGGLDSNFVNNINNMGTVTYSPLAEGLATIGHYYGSSAIKQYVSEEYCQKNFVIVLTSGFSSEDGTSDNQSVPSILADFDGDNNSDGIGEGNISIDGVVSAIPHNMNGTSHLDDVAYYLRTNDVVYSATPSFKNLSTYTVGIQSGPLSRAFLINTSNNGNGALNLYDASDPEYGAYHFEADSPEDIGESLLGALNNILSKTTTFTAPVVPVTRTMSGKTIYLSFFRPAEGLFWEGDVRKFALDSSNQIIDAYGNPATWPNGAMRENAVPIWSTRDWSETMHHSTREIVTYLGEANLNDAGNAFTIDNVTAAQLGNPVTAANVDDSSRIIAFVRGADAYDEDGDTVLDENRQVVTADSLHGKPVVFTFVHQSAEGDPQIDSAETRVFFGANDGMLHAVDDSDGSEAWGFIPPDLLPGLQNMVYGVGHPIFIDSSPRLCFLDRDRDGNIDDFNGNGFVDVEEDDRVLLVFGERGGGSAYHALDVTDPDAPVYQWGFSKDAAWGSAPQTVPWLGGSWSEPVFGRIKIEHDTESLEPPDETDPNLDYHNVIIVGGGFSENGTAGRGVLVVDVETGEVLKEFRNTADNNIGMNFPIPSSVTAIDADDNGFLDKVYVGDVGGRMWRLGQFVNEEGVELPFPQSEEDISRWSAEVLFFAGCDESDCSDTSDNDSDGEVDEFRPFYFGPEVVLEKGYDLIVTGTGDRFHSCNRHTTDRVLAVRDNHRTSQLSAADGNLVNLYDATPNLDFPVDDVDDNDLEDLGFYLPLLPGEKILAEAVVFYRIIYMTSFEPNDAPCVPGGDAWLYAFEYKTGAPKIEEEENKSMVRKEKVGGGIASDPVVIMNEDGTKLMISVGEASPDEDSESTGAGARASNPPSPPPSLLLRWWQELFN